MIEKNIDINVIRQNIMKLKKLSPKLFCAVVKANAYGHGVEICREIEDLVDFFAVANAKEALQIKKLKIHKRILILGKCSYTDLPNLIKKGIRLTVDTIDDVAHIITMAMSMHKRAYVHIKINSGMNRLGVKSKSDLKNIYDTLKQCPYVKIEGIYTHFATADNKNSYKLKRQNAKFLAMLSVIPQSDLKKMIIHASNSSAFLKSSKYAYDMVRVGIAMYGYDQVDKVKLSPALELKAKIVKTQNVKCGETIGYDAEFVAPQDMTIAVVAMGYADGFMRAYKKGYVLINGTRCKIVGKICMDMFMCDVTHLCVKVNCDKEIQKEPYIDIDNLLINSEEKNAHINNKKSNGKNENEQNKTGFETLRVNTKNKLDNEESVKNCENDTQNKEKFNFLDEISTIFNKDVPEKLFINNDTIYKLFDNGMSASSIFNIIPLEEILQNILAKVQNEVERIENEENGENNANENLSNEINNSINGKVRKENEFNVELQNLNNSDKINNYNENEQIKLKKQINENKANKIKKSVNDKESTKCEQIEIENLIDEWATILGQNGNEILTARDWAKLANTIEYEVLTTFNLARL